jgi:hypothetical protein
MANTAFSNLPTVIALNGNELVCVSQYNALLETWTSYACTTEQISALFNGIPTGTPSIRQIKASMEAQGVLVDVSQAVPGDITDPNFIAWNSAFRMAQNDPFVTNFLLGENILTQTQVTTIWADAPNYPV